METNTLVTHKKRSSLGIGCISKVMKNSLKVNFGTQDTVTCNPTMLNVIDTSDCKTMSFAEFNSKSITNGFKSGNVRVIIGNELKEYVGIGWITIRVVTYDDLKKYERVI